MRTSSSDDRLNILAAEYRDDGSIHHDEHLSAHVITSQKTAVNFGGQLDGVDEEESVSDSSDAGS